MSSTGRNRADRALRELSDYPTPEDLVTVCLDEVLFPQIAPGSRVLEGHVGDGAWLLGLLARPDLQLEVMDLDPLAEGLEIARAVGATVTPCRPASSLVEAGFLITDPTHPPDWIVGNPPYSITEPVLDESGDPTRYPDDHPKKPGEIVTRTHYILEHHVRRALQLARVGVAFVLPVGFLGSRDRAVGRKVPRGHEPTPVEVELGIYGPGLYRRHRPRDTHLLVPRPSYRFGGTDSADSVLVVWRRDMPPCLTWSQSHLVWRDDGR